MGDWEKAGDIAAQALEYGKSLINVGASLFAVTEKIEKKIEKLNGKLAFPINISINNVAAHNIAENKDEKFKKGDLVKLDVGVHVNGCIGDNAATIDLGNHAELVKASEKALEEAIKVIKIGIKLNEIGKVIDKTIRGFGFKPIRNLSGHEIQEYEQHAGLTVPNYDNNDKTELEKGMVIAIEPFATDGAGLIEESKPSGIFRIALLKNIRSGIARDVLKHIFEEYKTLPFAKKWLLKKFPEFKVNFALRMLEREKILHQYPRLVEKGNGLVSQAEHTLLIDDEVKILTKR